jgi:diguanylate cyclase
MHKRLGGSGSALRLFLVYAAVSAVPVVVLGLVLASAFQTEAARRGLDAGRAQAALVEATVIAPIVQGVDVRSLDAAGRERLAIVVSKAISGGAVVRLRLRDIHGNVVFSGDGSGFGDVPEDEALAAARGQVEASIKRLNSDANDVGALGQEVVEVYQPIIPASSKPPVGVMEIYLPYAPIAQDVSAGLGTLYRDLVIGLVLVYLVLAGLSLATTSRLRRHNQRNAYLAEHDQLTDLPNRRLFLTHVADLADGPPGTRAAVAVLDLDRFKDVNDVLGHSNGDALLQEVGRRLAQSVGPGDMVARLGGDEFGIVLGPESDSLQSQVVLEALLGEISRPIVLDGLPLQVDASVGFAMLPADAADPETLLRRADIAMYVAKAGLSGVVRYDRAQDKFDANRLKVVAELRRALAADELVLHYQPKMRPQDGAVTGVEALIRWQHPRQGLLYPDVFLPLAEQTGLIAPLTDWVIRTALAQIGLWGDGAEGISVAVNVSARNLSQPGFAESVLAALTHSRTPPGRVVIEVTETALLADVDRATAALTSLATAGVRVSLDDFGQGQTSLGYLARLPLQELKIDRVFVTDMVHDASHAAIVRSIIELAHNLGLSVVAEGVEDLPTLAALADSGCDVIQGYVLARPMPAAQLPGWLAQHQPLVFAG